MVFFLAIRDNDVWLHTSIGGQQNAAIPPSMRRLDSSGEIDFTVGHRQPLPDLVSVSVSPACKWQIKILAERVGFEFTRKRSFNNIERAAGTVKQLEGSGKQF